MTNKNSEKFNELTQSFMNLPTIGKKTAMRLAYFVTISDPTLGMKLAHSIENAIRFIKPCIKCGGLSENELCEICSDENRNKELVCIVDDPKDILILEENGSFDGLYFVLKHLDESHIKNLRAFLLEFGCKELIFALTHNINSEATMLFVEEKIKDLKLKITQIAQGIPSGVHLENVDSISLYKAIHFRTKLD